MHYIMKSKVQPILYIQDKDHKGKIRINRYYILNLNFYVIHILRRMKTSILFYDVCKTNSLNDC